MGILARLFEQRDIGDSLRPGERILWGLGGTTTATGQTVNETTALNMSAVYAAVRLLAETVGSLPLMVYKRDGRDKDVDREHPLYSVLHDLPNPFITAMELREVLMAHLNLWGNAYCEIVRDRGGRVRQLWPITPSRVRPELLDSRTLLYWVRMPEGGERAIDAADIWHVKAFSTDAVLGMSVISKAREAIGLAMAAERYGARFFNNDSRPGGILTTDKSLKPEAAQKIKASWEAVQRGTDNAWRVAVLEEGLHWESIGIPPEDAQFMQLRQYQIEEIARWFNIKPHMLADLSRATFSNIEHQSLEFVTYSLRPWLVRFEQSITRDLLAPSERATWFVEHKVDGLLRGDIKSRYEAYAVARQNGWMSPNDIRGLENMNPIEGGDEYLSPLNMAPLGEHSPEPEPTATARALVKPPVATIETRAAAIDWGGQRREIGQSYRRLVAEASARMVRREEADIMRQARKMLRAGDWQGLVEWMEQFYREHPDFVKRTLGPVIESLAEQINANAARQIEREPDYGEELQRFVAAYVDTAATDHCYNSLGQLRSIVNEAAAAQAEDPEWVDTAIDGLQTRFDEWHETRPDKEARLHTVRCAGAVTTETWRRGGVRRLEWVTHGKSCELCNSLNGMQVDMGGAFMDAGQTLTVASGNSLTTRGRIGHAPLHEGCDCGLAPGW